MWIYSDKTIMFTKKASATFSVEIFWGRSNFGALLSTAQAVVVSWT